MIQTRNSLQINISLREVRSRATRVNNTLLLPLGALTSVGSAMAQDPGWPRQLTRQGTKLVIYQPQIDDWNKFEELAGRVAFAMTPAGGKEVVGAANFEAATDTDTANRSVVVHDLKFNNIYFPSLPAAIAPAMASLFRTFIPASVTMSLDRVAASVKKPDSVATVELNNNPPRIFVSYHPAILLEINGEPVLAEVPGTQLRYVVNTTWPLFLETSKSEDFLRAPAQPRSGEVRWPPGATRP